MTRLIRKLDTPIENKSVLKNWVVRLPWKMQAVLIQGLRAPDTHFCERIKNVSRWMRSLVLKNADKKHTFMCTQNDLPDVEDLENELNYCSVHFFTHFIYAIEIIKYKHPERSVKLIASNLYRGIVAEMSHFDIETEKQLDIRLSDVDREEEVEVKCPVRHLDRYLR